MAGLPRAYESVPDGAANDVCKMLMHTAIAQKPSKPSLARIYPGCKRKTGMEER